MSNIFYLPRVKSLPGAKLTFSISGTTTLQNTYTDIGLTVAHSNPVVADAEGYFDPIYLDPALPNYRVKHTTSDNVLIEQRDDVPAIGSSGQSLTLISSGAHVLLRDNSQVSGQRMWKIALSGRHLYIGPADDSGVMSDEAIILENDGGLVSSIKLGAFVNGLTFRDIRVMPMMAVKPSDTARTSTVTLANDPDLVLQIPEGGQYEIEAFLRFNGGGGGFSRALTYSGTVHADGINVGGLSHVNGTGSVVAAASGTATVSNATITASGVGDYHHIIGTAHFTTSGDLRVQWAQNSSNATATTLKAGSLIRARKLAAATS